MTADEAISAARECLGTPFHHQGRIKGIALDCAGLIVSVAHDLGLEYIDQQGYGRDPYKDLLRTALNEQPCLTVVPLDQMQAGDVLLMRFGREPQHLAIYTGSGIIHSFETVGIVCEHDLTEVWRRRILAVYRFKESV